MKIVSQKCLLTRKIFSVILTVSLITLFSCRNEEISSMDSSLPTLKFSGKAGVEQIEDIRNSQLLLNGRIDQISDYDNAIAATYEGYERVSLVYIPSTTASNEFYLYTFKDEKLTDLFLKVRNEENSFSIITSEGEVNFKLDKNLVTKIDLTRLSNLNINGRVNACNLAGNFMAYQNEVQNQLVRSVGSTAALAIDIGCSLWVVCRGAVVIAGAAYAAGQCIK